MHRHRTFIYSQNKISQCLIRLSWKMLSILVNLYTPTKEHSLSVSTFFPNLYRVSDMICTVSMWSFSWSHHCLFIIFTSMPFVTLWLSELVIIFGWLKIWHFLVYVKSNSTKFNWFYPELSHSNFSKWLHPLKLENFSDWSVNFLICLL